MGANRPRYIQLDFRRPISGVAQHRAELRLARVRQMVTAAYKVARDIRTFLGDVDAARTADLTLDALQNEQRRIERYLLTAREGDTL